MSTVVEALLQRNPEYVMLSIDLRNCFNALDRDKLIGACLADPVTAPLAHYVAATYPKGVVARIRIEDDWRLLEMTRGIAQGRPLSPVLVSILLQPAIKEAYRAMAGQMGLDPDSEAARLKIEAARPKIGAGGYLNDLALVDPPTAVAAGFLAFRHEVTRVGR